MPKFVVMLRQRHPTVLQRDAAARQRCGALLVRRLGGPDRAGIGFAAGIERLVLAMPSNLQRTRPDVFVVAIGGDAFGPAHLLTRDLRHEGVSSCVDYDGRSLRAQMKRADRMGVEHVLIVGGDELARGEVTVKNMESGDESTVLRADVVNKLREVMSKASLSDTR